MIVYILLAQGRRDLANLKGVTGLNMPDESSRFAILCKSLLALFSKIDNENNDHIQIGVLVRLHLANLANDVITYNNAPIAERNIAQMVIHERLYIMMASLIKFSQQMLNEPQQERNIRRALFN